MRSFDVQQCKRFPECVDLLHSVISKYCLRCMKVSKVLRTAFPLSLRFILLPFSKAINVVQKLFPPSTISGIVRQKKQNIRTELQLLF